MSNENLISEFNKKIKELQEIAGQERVKVYLHQLITRHATDETLKKMIKEIQQTKITWKEE